jgi:hypothetical protein
MRSDARQRLLTIAGGGLTVKSGVTGVAPLDRPRELQPVTPAAWKNPQLDQCVTPVTPCHTSELEGYKGAAGNNGIRGFRPGVTLSVTAAEGLARLDPGSPPCDVPMTRWVHFIDDCRRFLDDGWANCAERLGWTPLDLFSCDSTKPLVRINRAGLLWLLNGRQLLALSADAAAIATANGGYLTLQRRKREPGGVLAWELSREADVQ